jgi:hypothetical protein
MAKQKHHGAPWLTDDTTGDLLGVRDDDSSEFFWLRDPRLGVFFDTTTQTDGVVPMAFNTQAITRGVTMKDGTKVVVDRSGIYELQLSVHIHNTSAQFHTFELWGRLNGADIANSRFIYSVPAKHGAIPGAVIPSQNFWLAINAGDEVQMVWATDSANVRITYHAAEVGRPISPSLLLTVKEIAPLTQPR